MATHITSSLGINTYRADKVQLLNWDITCGDDCLAVKGVSLFETTRFVCQSYQHSARIQRTFMLRTTRVVVETVSPSDRWVNTSISYVSISNQFPFSLKMSMKSDIVQNVTLEDFHVSNTSGHRWKPPLLTLRRISALTRVYSLIWVLACI